MSENDDNEEEQSGQQTDIDKLRSEYDTKIADLSKERDTFQTQLDQLKRTLTEGDVANGALDDIQARIAAIDRGDPEKAVAAFEQLTAQLGTALATQQVKGVRVQGLYKETLAKTFAQEIAHEHGGDWKTYQKELISNSRTDSQMEQNASLLKQRVGLEKQTKNGNGNGGGKGRDFSVDNGRGAPVRNNVMKMMDDIDINTPEGRAEWEAKEKTIAARVREASR